MPENFIDGCFVYIHKKKADNTADFTFPQYQLILFCSVTENNG